MAKDMRTHGPNCANLVNGQCGFAGGRCIDGSTINGTKFTCPYWKSMERRTAALVRWAKKRRGSGKIGRS